MKSLVTDERVAIDHLMTMGDREDSTGVASYFVEDAVRTAFCCRPCFCFFDYSAHNVNGGNQWTN